MNGTVELVPSVADAFADLVVRTLAEERHDQDQQRARNDHKQACFDG